LLSQGLDFFKNKRVLLLQGPVGSFFYRFSQDLKRHGAIVHKVNFNLGDCFYYPFNAHFYCGEMDQWPQYFESLIHAEQITHVILFGDCRFIHKSIHAIAESNNIEVYVFEEGYFRPNHITFEKHGVNDRSKLPRDADFFKMQSSNRIPVIRIPNTYWSMIWRGMSYHFFLWLGQFVFRKYKHHRSINLTSLFPWILSAYRKVYFYFLEGDIQALLTTKYSKRFFLAPLQIFSDSQIREHSDFKSIYSYIDTIIESFARNASEEDILVIKHHSMDRGDVDYSAHIKGLKSKHHINDRIYYIHDQHLPTLLNHARGVVVVNSTVGLSAITHLVPTKVLGRALYDIEGLSYQGDLDQFWSDAELYKPHHVLVDKFVNHLIEKTQVNGSFYRPVKAFGYRSGVFWS
jgi:capsular polysaccharide export protein